MKFILIMQMCFIIDGNCSPVFQNKKVLYEIRQKKEKLIKELRLLKNE